MDLLLGDKVAVISGSTAGIGFHIALTLAMEGAKVLINGRDPRAVEVAVTRINGTCPGSARGYVGDVTEEDTAGLLIGTAVSQFGQVDIVVNNVGGSDPRPFVETTDDQWLHAFNLNLFQAIRMCRAVIPHMQSRNSGAILNIASIAGRESGSAMTYNAAKSSVISFSKALAREVIADGVRVNSIAPGSVFFPGGIWDQRLGDSPEKLADFVQANLPSGRFGTPEEVAAVAAFMVSGRASMVSGACWTVDGCQSRSNI